MASTSELACVYAALILTDDDIQISADKINKILGAANVIVEPYWPGLFAKALEGIDVKALISNVGVGGGGGAAAGGGAAEAQQEEAPKEEVKEESEEESDDDMGFGLFD